MSWQGDVKKLHERAKSVDVDLSEFEEEVKGEDGWYTEDNVLTLVECILDELENFQDSLVIKE